MGFWSRILPRRMPVGLLLALPVFFLHYFVIPGLYDPGLHSKYIFLAFYLVMLALIGLFRKNQASVALAKIPAWWAALALPAILSVSLLWARTPMEGLPTVARWWEVFLLLSLLLVVFSGDSERERFHRWLPRLGAVFVLVTSLAALGQLAWVVRGQGYSHGSTYWVLVSFAHRNLLSHAIALALPLALLEFLRAKRIDGWMVVAGLALGLGMATLLLLLVRTSWLAVGVAGLAFGLLWWRARRGMEAGVRRRAERRVAVLLGIGLVALVAGWLTFRPAVLEKGMLEKHGRGMVKAHYGSPAERSLFWGRTIDLWKMRPLTGHGAGSWKIEAPGREIGSSRKSIGRGEVYVVRAHNDWLQLLAEGGSGALLAFLLMGAFSASVSVRKSHSSPFKSLPAPSSPFELPRDRFLRTSSSGQVPQGRDLRAGVETGAGELAGVCYSLGVVIYLVIAFFSFPMERPSSYVWWAIYPAALLLSGVANGLPMRVPGKGNLLSRLAMLVLALGLAGLGWMWVKLDGRWLAAMDAGAAGKHGEVVRLLDDHTLSRLPLAPATTPLPWYRGMAYLELRDTLTALADFKYAYRLHPRHPHVLNNLATLLNKEGDTETARAHLQSAVQIAPLMEEVRLYLAALEFNAGRIDTAYSHLRVVPDSTTNAIYPIYREVIVGGMIEEIMDGHQGEKVYPILKAIHQKPDWMAKLHAKSINNHLGLEHQVLLDAIYILREKRKSISLEESELLYNQYLLDSIR